LLFIYPLPSGRDFNLTPARFFTLNYEFLWDDCESISSDVRGG